jgi:hypothetical protein
MKMIRDNQLSLENFYKNSRSHVESFLKLNENSGQEIWKNKQETFKKQDILRKTNHLLSFHCNVSIWYGKYKENISMYA